MRPGPVWLERGREGDAGQLAALEAVSFSHPWTERQFREELTREGPGAVLVLRARGAAGAHELAAYCSYRVHVDEMHVMTVAVAPRWRRRGLGTWLLRFCVARAGEEGAQRAFLEVRAGNQAARSVYAQLGFREAGRRPGYYVEPGEDAIVLTLDPLPSGSS